MKTNKPNVKVRFEGRKPYRIRRFARPYVGWDKPRTHEFRDDGDLLLYQTPQGIVVVKRKWETERLRDGLPTYSTSPYKTTDYVRARTVKAAKRKLKRIASQLPHGTKFRDFAGWVGFGVIYTVHNPGYDEAAWRDKAYANIPVAPQFSAVSHNASFDRIVNALRKAGYFVAITEEGNPNRYWFAAVTGKNIRAGFCTRNEESYSYINNKIAADHEECFDKWSKCAFSVSLPKNDMEVNNLLLELEHLSSPDGYEASNDFEYRCKFIKITEPDIES